MLNPKDAKDPGDRVDGSIVDFCLPQGYRDPAGLWHREGRLRPALAREEIRAQSDFRVYLHPECFLDILLAQVILQLGHLDKVDVGVVQRLPAGDRAFLQQLYREVNGYLPGELQ